ncbi:MAG: aminotransferase class I/II-fold pyridoxal phosphate-dependent enzyme [Galbitalea sp.]
MWFSNPNHSHGDGVFTRSATEKLRGITGAAHALLTTSCTHALEMSVRLLGIGVGDEVILPSFTFPSAANAVAMTGARCVFVDIDPRTGNLDFEQVEEAAGSRTRAVIVMHYGGVPVDIEAMLAIRERGGPCPHRGQRPRPRCADASGGPRRIRRAGHPEFPRHQERAQRRGWRAVDQ